MSDNRPESALLATDRLEPAGSDHREKTLPHQETQTEYESETADLTPYFNVGGAEVRKCPSPPKPSAPNSLPTPTRRPREQNAFVIVTDPDDGHLETEQTEAGWLPKLSGMPSWLTSLIFHLSLMLTMALISISNGGRSVIEMLASAGEAVEIEPYTTFDVALQPVELEYLSEAIEVPESQLMQATDLAPVLENALRDASLASESTDSFYESLATAGVPDSDLPRRENGGEAKFFGVGGTGADFVFIVDCSGSMADYGRWQRAVGELKKSISSLKEDQRFLILLYNDGFIAMNSDASLVKSDSRSRKKAIKWLTKNQPNSWTYCAEALGKALSLKPDAVFLLSDGEFNDRQDVFLVLETMNNRERLTRYKQRQVPIHTIALGSHFGHYSMKRIADENGGEFKLVE